MLTALAATLLVGTAIAQAAATGATGVPSARPVRDGAETAAPNAHPVRDAVETGAPDTRLMRDAVETGAPDAPSPRPSRDGVETIRARPDGLLDVVNVPTGAVMRYTLDGTEPTREAGIWLAPVQAPPGYTVKARAFTADHTPIGSLLEWTSPATGTRIASTLVPVTQARDWRVYDWPARHAAAVALMRERQPEIVMLGDSIIHFWGGDPSGERIGGRCTAPEVYDFLHPTPKGYEIWADAMKPTLDRLLAP